MIEVVFLLIVITIFFQKFGKKWIFHLLLNLIMYLFYCFLWVIILIPKDPEQHHGDSGLGLGLFTLITAPFYIIFNIFSIVYSRKISNKRIQNINSIGLIICILHILIFCFMVSIL
jgi:hypothetical protein